MVRLDELAAASLPAHAINSRPSTVVIAVSASPLAIGWYVTVPRVACALAQASTIETIIQIAQTATPARFGSRSRWADLTTQFCGQSASPPWGRLGLTVCERDRTADG